MNPSRLPDRILNDRKRRGEIKVFESLSKLPDDYEVFYNRCPNSGNATKPFERPIDFIVIHEKRGLLAIEVKGGKIRIGDDGDFEQFYNKRWNFIDPFTQVKVAFIELAKTIRNDGGNYWIPCDLCVVFPDTTRLELTNKPQSLQAGTLCAEDLPILAVLVPKLFSKDQMWKKRDEFIDVRRRLKNMPEASHRSPPSQDISTSASRSQQYSAPTNWEYSTPDPEPALPASVTYSRAANYRPYKKKSGRKNLSRPAESRIKELKLWEILLAVIAAIIVFFVVLYFLSGQKIPLIRYN